MASIRDSVIDQYGNAVVGAQVVLFSLATGNQIGSVNTDINGYFEFANVATGGYKLQISGAGLTTRIIEPITIVNPYNPATQTADGLMSAADKTKLDGLGGTFDSLTDVTITSPTSGDILTYNTSGYWYNVKAVDSLFALKQNFVVSGGTVQEAGKYVKLDGVGRIDYSLLNVTPLGGASYAGRILTLNVVGKVDATAFDATDVGGSAYNGMLAKLNAGGFIDITMINYAEVGGASAAGKIPVLNDSGRLDPSMLPTAGGTFRGSIDLTIPYVDPGWADGDYGATSVAGPVDASWNAHLNDPIPTTVKVGDQVYFTGGKYSVVPATTDLDAYLPRDGSKPMTGQLPLIDQTSALPTGVQALSRGAGDILYQARQAGAAPSVTQPTDKNTPVTLNAITGKIVTAASSLTTAAMAGPRPAAFVLSNNQITVDSTITVNHIAGGTAGSYRVWAGQITAGTCTIYLENITGAALAQAITLQFHVEK